VEMLTKYQQQLLPISDFTLALFKAFLSDERENIYTINSDKDKKLCIRILYQSSKLDTGN
jgi:hypothetical protein